MPQGTVKSFDDGRGYGFILQDGGDDVFVHHKAIQDKGVHRLAKGDRVMFEVVAGPKGSRAVNVCKM